MARGISVHIGLNSVDPGHYAGWSGPLNACEADARDMAALATAAGFTSRLLLTRDATIAPVTAAIADSLTQAGDDDIVLITYSGHGGQVPDLNQDGDEPDGLDETWCLYDGQLVDDQLFALLARSTTRSRVLVLSDSCHSGSVLRAAFNNILQLTTPLVEASRHSMTVKSMPRQVCEKTFTQNQAFYQAILLDPQLASARSRITVRALLISGCADSQYSYDGEINGQFTSALLGVWRHGTFSGDYSQFHAAISTRLPPYQTPQLFWPGTPDLGFLGQSPFSI